MEHKKTLNEKVGISDAKPVAGIVQDELLHPVFHEQLKTYYRVLSKEKEDFTSLIFSGLLLNLFFDSYISWVSRYLVTNINRHNNRKLQRLWEEHYEKEASLIKKVQFFIYSFPINPDVSVVKSIEDFTEKLSSLRNKIVHGHEISKITWSNGAIDKTRLAELLTFDIITEYYDGLEKCMTSIATLFETIDYIDMTQGIPSKNWIINHLKFDFKRE